MDHTTGPCTVAFEEVGATCGAPGLPTVVDGPTPAGLVEPVCREHRASHGWALAADAIGEPVTLRVGGTGRLGAMIEPGAASFVATVPDGAPGTLAGRYDDLTHDPTPKLGVEWLVVHVALDTPGLELDPNLPDHELEGVEHLTVPCVADHVDARQ